MDNSASSGHGGPPSPVDIVTWLDHSTIDRQFFQHVVSEEALQAALQQGLLKGSDEGYCRGESFESGEVTDEASLRKVLLSLDEWLSANPTDPRFWRTQYAPMSRHAVAAGRHALTGAHGEAAVQMLTRVATYLNLASRFDESIEAGTLARDLAKKYFGRDSEPFAAACVALGNVVAEHENKSRGRKLLNDALKIREALHGRRSLPVANSLLHLGALCRNQQKFEESYDHFELCLEIRESLLPPDHLDVAEALDAFGLSHYYREMPEGIDFVERGLEIRGKVLPEDHPWLAESLNNLALFLEQSGVHADFESIYRRCLAISETWYGPLHVEICTHAENLAMLLRDQGRFVEAEELFRKVILMEEAMHGAECDLLPTHIHELVMCLMHPTRWMKPFPGFKEDCRLFVHGRTKRQEAVAASAVCRSMF